MRRASWHIGLALVAVLACGSQAFAQVCSGAVPISNTNRINAGGSLLFAEDTMGFTGIVQGGNSNFFGGLQIGRVTADAPGEDLSSTVIGGRVGAQYTYEMNRPLHICPVFNLSRASASDAFDVDGLDLSSTSIGFGADVGLLAMESGTMQIVPTGGLYFARVSVKEEFDGEEIFDDSETGAILNLGVGLLFNQRFSITPLVSFSMGFGDDDDGDSSNTSFSITALYSFGRR